MKKKILFVAYGGGHINIIDLIAEKLIVEKEIDFKILALTTAYNQVVGKYPRGIVKKISDYNFLFEKDKEKIYKYGEELLGNTYDKSISISKKDLIFYLGISMLELVKMYGYIEAKKMYQQQGRKAFKPIKIMEKILQYEKINVVVSTTSPRFEQASLIAGNNLNIKTVQIIDLFSQLSCSPEAKNIIAMNKSIIDLILLKYNKKVNYYVLGQPVIENSAKKVLSINKQRLYKKIGINEHKNVLLFASQVPVLHDKKCNSIGVIDYKLTNDKIFLLLNKLFQKYKIEILFRLHPNEDIKNYKEYFIKYSFVRYINAQLNIYESLAIADFVITPFSTVGLEAVASNKMVFTYKNDFDMCYPIEEMRQPPFNYADNFNDLYYLISKTISESSKATNDIDNPYSSIDSVQKIIKFLKEV